MLGRFILREELTILQRLMSKMWTHYLAMSQKDNSLATRTAIGIPYVANWFLELKRASPPDFLQLT